VIFDYPESRDCRRHGPDGYAAYESYRPWLRDEFDFRCAYCLKRETWGQIASEFELDHFRPQSSNPRLLLDYQNLVYACRRCNAVKGAQSTGDPFLLLRVALAKFHPDGSLRSLDIATQRLIEQLDLNSPRLKEWRIMWMRIVALAKDRDPILYSQLVAFPENLPNLRNLRPPRNTRKQGLPQSWFAQRERGELPVAY
jgi:5-methylcytosine-specific restriction endonuclease McrA